MALSSSKVSTATTVGTSSAPARPAATARAFSATGMPQIENIHYGVPAGPDRDWVRSEEWGTGGGSGTRQRGHARHAVEDEFTPLVGRLAAAHSANEQAPPPASASTRSKAFVADIHRGVGIYETNMKVIAGTSRTLGRAFSRYF